ncbi:MAG: Periplasmic dipeptide transport protein [Chroococcidiopsis cubana SAG 39.79]|uniref:ABC transporter substrate-binding protein n=1 Tax=Chroococcidiopsis cubana TaxID=171392 RepID=UPI000D05ED6A|nr:ABC transporter substrate-binding protein [Chroococcidiopsis cubana]MDZ4874518.1 Periplasmic dipeptide transport protein [Chroococcidiopsis cubana SAG 39.79]PSB63293.1 peptide ABC transporter substrate-binding protein [Chroococcidiopsis cubana CCALA 043]
MNWFGLSRRQFWSWGKFFSLLSLCCLLIVSCNTSRPPAQTTTPATGGGGGGNSRITVGTTLRPRTIDPADNYELAGTNITTSLCDRLYTYKLGTGELEPQLATALPKVSQDGLTYTIPIRTGVVFHDGTPFNAEAMAFSLNRFIKNGGKPSALLSDVVSSVAATGNDQITIKLKNSFAAFPSVLAFPGMCAVSPKAYQIGSGKFLPTKFVGTGPYQLRQFTPNLVRMDAFDKYWGAKPTNQGIDFQILSNAANLYNSFRTGAVDIAYQTFDPQQVESLKQQATSKGWQAIEEKSNTVTHMILNVKQKPLDQLEVRQAIASMIDRPLLIQRVYQNQAQPLYSMLPDTFDSYKPVFQSAYGDGNVEKAKALLAKAGYTKENPLKLQVVYPGYSLIREQIAGTLRGYAAQKLEGIIQIQPQPEESATFFANQAKGAYQAILQDWYPDFGDPDNYIQPFLSCPKGDASGCENGASQSQGSFYYSDRMNKLIAQQRQAQDPQARAKIFGEIQDAIAQDVPIIPLVQNKDYVFAQKGLQGVQIDPILKLPLWQIKKG